MSKLGDKLKNGKLAAWVKDKAPGVAGTVLGLVGDFTGRDGFNKLADKITGELPDELRGEFEAQRQQFELDYYRAEADHEREMHALAVQDRDSARKREQEYVRAGHRDYMQMAVGIIGLGLLIYLTYNIVTRPDMSENVLLVHLLGIVEGVAISIYNYYYGSSKGSKDKTRAIMNN